MKITQRQKRHSKKCDFSANEKSLGEHSFYVGQTPLTCRFPDGSGMQYTEICAGPYRLLLKREEVEHLQRRLAEISKPSATALPLKTF